MQDRMARPSMAAFQRFQEDTEEAGEQRQHVDAGAIGRKILELGPRFQAALKVSRLVKWERVMVVVVPLVTQFGEIMIDVANEIMTAQREKERAQQWSELMERLREEAAGIEIQATVRFNTACDEVRQWLRQRIKTFEDSQAKLNRQVEDLRAGVRRIDEVLNDQQQTRGSTQRARSRAEHRAPRSTRRSWHAGRG